MVAFEKLTNVTSRSALTVAIDWNCVSLGIRYGKSMKVALTGWDNNRFYGWVSNTLWLFSEPPKSTRLCPRQNGYFAHPQEDLCHIFYQCINSGKLINWITQFIYFLSDFVEATEVVCPTGLHFDEYSGICVWPDTAGRTGCSARDESTTSPIRILNKNLMNRFRVEGRV